MDFLDMTCLGSLLTDDAVMNTDASALVAGTNGSLAFAGDYCSTSYNGVALQKWSLGKYVEARSGHQTSAISLVHIQPTS